MQRRPITRSPRPQPDGKTEVRLIELFDDPIAEGIRFRLAQSMPLVERRRAEILPGIQDRMVPADPTGQGPSNEVVAASLLNLLIDCGSDIAAFGALRGLAGIRKQHLRLGISGRHYSRFGLALGPALRNVLGFSVSSEAITGWCDAFWIIIRKINRVDARSATILGDAVSGTAVNAGSQRRSDVHLSSPARKRR